MAAGARCSARPPQEAGRDPDKITIAVEKLTAIHTDRDQALEWALPTVKQSSMTYERDVDDLSSPRDRHIFGSVDDVRRRIEEFAATGVEHFELEAMYPTLDDLLFQMDLWAKTILAEYGAKVTV